MKTANSKATRQKLFRLIKDYFVNSDEKLFAWLHVLGITFCVIAVVALMMTFSWWTAGFWVALEAKTLMPFLVCMGQFSVMLSVLAGISVLRNYLVGKLSLHWRKWLTNKITNKLFDSENNYLELARTSKIDNIGQRIQEDVKSFVDLTLNLGANLLQSVLSLITFAGTLWVVGGALSFVALGLNIVIPGYLVWISLILGVAASAATHFIGKSLVKTNREAESAEAELRNDVTQLNNDAENIAEEHAEKYYKKSINNKVEGLKEINNKKLDIQTRIFSFQNFYAQLSSVLPFIFAAPLYFSGLIEMAQLMQIAMSFSQVSSALNWFVDAYENLATYKTNIDRINELQNKFEKDGLSSNPKSITRKVRDKESIYVKRLNIMTPEVSSSNYILRNLKIKFMPGEHTLIQAPSGVGKSTLFKAIAGTWKYGDGKVSVPSNKRLYMLPQKPTLPTDTLRAVLAYPEPADTYSEKQCAAALQAVGGMDDFVDKLAEKRNWSKEFSGGQQQRVSFARALLKKPDWLFLDEATSSLDEEAEEHVYREVSKLKNTTMVSIAHRSTVEKHHSRVVRFNADKNKEIIVTESSGHEREKVAGSSSLQRVTN